MQIVFFWGEQVRKTEVLDVLVSLLQHLMLVRKDGKLGCVAFVVLLLLTLFILLFLFVLSLWFVFLFSSCISYFFPFLLFSIFVILFSVLLFIPIFFCCIFSLLRFYFLLY